MHTAEAAITEMTTSTVQPIITVSERTYAFVLSMCMLEKMHPWLHSAKMMLSLEEDYFKVGLSMGKATLFRTILLLKRSIT